MIKTCGFVLSVDKALRNILVALGRLPIESWNVRAGVGAKCGVGTYSNKAYCGHADFKKACGCFCSCKAASPTTKAPTKAPTKASTKAPTKAPTKQSTTARPTAACADAYKQCGGKSSANWNNHTGTTDPRVSLPAGGQPLLRARLPDSNPIVRHRHEHPLALLRGVVCAASRQFMGELTAQVALSHATDSLVFVPGFAVGKLGNPNLRG